MDYFIVCRGCQGKDEGMMTIKIADEKQGKNKNCDGITKGVNKIWTKNPKTLPEVVVNKIWTNEYRIPSVLLSHRIIEVYGIIILQIYLHKNQI